MILPWRINSCRNRTAAEQHAQKKELEALLEVYKDVFRAELREQLPPKRTVDHCIDTGDSASVNTNAYPLSAQQVKEQLKQIHDQTWLNVPCARARHGTARHVACPCPLFFVACRAVPKNLGTLRARAVPVPPRFLACRARARVCGHARARHGTARHGTLNYVAHKRTTNA